MSLVKIPVIILVDRAYKTIGAHRIASQRASSTEPDVPTSSLDKRLWMDLVTKSYIFQTIFSALEIAMILANAFPQYPISHIVLSKITFSDDGYTHQPRLTTINDMFGADVTIHKNHRLIKTGTYSVLRHPCYTGYLVAIIGWVMWHLAEGSWLGESGLLGSWYGRTIAVVFGAFVLLGVPIVFRRVPKKDAALRKNFGKEWEEWAKEVPYAFFPGIW
ncbi:hypothetical protein D9613_009103 [Agrocybe pediades]|uniref:Protein-S-isoprenylcysteine O-methyltransferase n=1 Tax=Agrocybe pediades TaxID=84607 RepID=A0A8H4VVP9_9AGAR|nr:hypothetical protein D9613_009103 [Agrocybe pediades]